MKIITSDDGNEFNDDSPNSNDDYNNDNGIDATNDDVMMTTTTIIIIMTMMVIFRLDFLTENDKFSIAAAKWETLQFWPSWKSRHYLDVTHIRPCDKMNI